MKYPPTPEVEKCRVAGPFGDNFGFFKIKHGAVRLNCQVASGMGWDHVSVSLPFRCPTWEEMDFVKDLFFNPDEVVMQLHVAKTDHINRHPYCLHLWRPQKMDEVLDNKERWQASGEKMPPESFWSTYPPIPLPPKETV